MMQRIQMMQVHKKFKFPLLSLNPPRSTGFINPISHRPTSWNNRLQKFMRISRTKCKIISELECLRTLLETLFKRRGKSAIHPLAKRIGRMLAVMNAIPMPSIRTISS